MKMPNNNQIKEGAFWVLLVAGVGVTVAGAFVPVLIPVGVALLSASIALAKDIAPVPAQIAPENPPRDRIDDNQLSSSGSNTDLDIHVDVTHHRRHHSRQPAHPVSDQPDVEDKKDSDHDVPKRHKRRP